MLKFTVTCLSPSSHWELFLLHYYITLSFFSLFLMCNSSNIIMQIFPNYDKPVLFGFVTLFKTEMLLLMPRISAFWVQTWYWILSWVPFYPEDRTRFSRVRHSSGKRRRFSDGWTTCHHARTPVNAGAHSYRVVRRT